MQVSKKYGLGTQTSHLQHRVAQEVSMFLRQYSPTSQKQSLLSRKRRLVSPKQHTNKTVRDNASHECLKSFLGQVLVSVLLMFISNRWKKMSSFVSVSTEYSMSSPRLTKIPTTDSTLVSNSSQDSNSLSAKTHKMVALAHFSMTAPLVSRSIFVPLLSLEPMAKVLLCVS